jgi:hypothetical protein
MSRGALRETTLCALVAAAGTAAVAWLGLYAYVWTDYEVEALPAYTALVHGHAVRFLQLCPVYGGSLVLRAPFALLAGALGGGPLAVYRAVALPCLLAAAALGVWLAADLRRRRFGPAARALALVLCVANPLTLGALEVGHPEDLLGGALCVAAVLAAGRGRALWAGVALGVAIANKEWALLALGPVLLALPHEAEPGVARARVVCTAAAGAVAAAILAPLALVHAGNFLAETRATGTTTSSIFQPWQLWWFFGHHGALVHGTFGRPKPGYRVGPAWAGTISHPLVLAIAVPLCALFWRRNRQARNRAAPERTRAALGLLALLLLARCALDTWDTAYYALPLLLALCAWECAGPRGTPLVAFAIAAAAWLDFEWLHTRVSPDAQAVVFLAWAVPLALGVALWLYAPERLRALREALAARLARSAALTRRRSTPSAAS